MEFFIATSWIKNVLRGKNMKWHKFSEELPRHQQSIIARSNNSDYIVENYILGDFWDWGHDDHYQIISTTRVTESDKEILNVYSVTLMLPEKKDSENAYHEWLSIVELNDL